MDKTVSTPLRSSTNKTTAAEICDICLKERLFVLPLYPPEDCAAIYTAFKLQIASDAHKICPKCLHFIRMLADFAEDLSERLAAPPAGECFACSSLGFIQGLKRTIIDNLVNEIRPNEIQSHKKYPTCADCLYRFEAMAKFRKKIQRSNLKITKDELSVQNVAQTPRKVAKLDTPTKPKSQTPQKTPHSDSKGRTPQKTPTLPNSFSLKRLPTLQKFAIVVKRVPPLQEQFNQTASPDLVSPSSSIPLETPPSPPPSAPVKRKMPPSEPSSEPKRRKIEPPPPVGIWPMVEAPVSLKPASEPEKTIETATAVGISPEATTVAKETPAEGTVSEMVDQSAPDKGIEAVNDAATVSIQEPPKETVESDLQPDISKMQISSDDSLSQSVPEIVQPSSIEEPSMTPLKAQTESPKRRKQERPKKRKSDITEAATNSGELTEPPIVVTEKKTVTSTPKKKATGEILTFDIKSLTKRGRSKKVQSLTSSSSSASIKEYPEEEIAIDTLDVDAMQKRYGVELKRLSIGLTRLSDDQLRQIESVSGPNSDDTTMVSIPSEKSEQNLQIVSVRSTDIEPKELPKVIEAEKAEKEARSDDIQLYRLNDSPTLVDQNKQNHQYSQSPRNSPPLEGFPDEMEQDFPKELPPVAAPVVEESKALEKIESAEQEKSLEPPPPQQKQEEEKRQQPEQQRQPEEQQQQQEEEQQQQPEEQQQQPEEEQQQGPEEQQQEPEEQQLVEATAKEAMEEAKEIEEVIFENGDEDEEYGMGSPGSMPGWKVVDEINDNEPTSPSGSSQGDASTTHSGSSSESEDEEATSSNVVSAKPNTDTPRQSLTIASPSREKRTNGNCNPSTPPSHGIVVSQTPPSPLLTEAPNSYAPSESSFVSGSLPEQLFDEELDQSSTRPRGILLSAEKKENSKVRKSVSFREDKMHELYSYTPETEDTASTISSDLLPDDDDDGMMEEASDDESFEECSEQVNETVATRAGESSASTTNNSACGNDNADSDLL